MATEIKLSIDGKEFDLEKTNTVPLAINLPRLLYNGYEYIALLKDTKPIQDWEIVRYGNKEFSIDANLKDGYDEDSPIFSVKRLSDNEIFSIDDEIKHKYHGEGCFAITAFYITDKNEIGCLGKNSFASVNYFIENWVKIKPKVPLFTTEDGVDIFEGQEFWRISLNDYWDNVSYYASSSMADNDRGRGRYFDKEKAKEYIWQNKPQLIRYKDLHDFYRAQVKPMQPNEDRIKEFFKSKINT